MAKRKRNEVETGSSRERAADPVAPRETWWTRNPERLEREFRELDDAGIRYERNLAMEAQGVMRVRVFPRLDDGEQGEVPLVAIFPDHYPYFQVLVEAPTLDLGHHQHPFAKTLCLLPRSTYYWNPASDTLAGMLTERLKLVMTAGATKDAGEAAPLEEHVPEPFSDYYPYEPNSIVLIAAGEDGRERVPASVTTGVIVLGIEGASAIGPIEPLLRAALLEVRDDAGNTLVKAPALLAGRYSRRIEGRWARVDAPVRAPTLEGAARAVYDTSEARDTSRYRVEKHALANGGAIRVRAVLFPEERRWRGESGAIGDGWAFAVRVQGSSGAASVGPRGRIPPDQFKIPRGKHASAPADYYLARPGRYAPEDLVARAPELRSMQKHTIAQFGAGCLGAPSAFEFARASVRRLRLLDHDTVDPATTMRWPLGVMMAGAYKAPLLANFLQAHYPYVSVSPEIWRIGAPRGISPDGVLNPDSEEDVIARMLDGASLVYDAAAEWGLQYFLSDIARAHGIPYISVQGTAGGWGGVVVRIMPETEGCWVCLQHWRGVPVDKGGIPAPAADDTNGYVTVDGCADPTYAGANFDLSPVAMLGVRTAISTLTAGDEGGYPATTWDVAVFSMRAPDGTLTVPAWTTHQLRRHPDCAACRARELHKA